VLAFVLALGSAATYGAADFLGGLAARRTDTVAVVVVSQAAGLVGLALVVAWRPDGTPSARDLAWGGAAGLAIAVGLALLYRALAIGRMSVVAPTTAVCAVVIPVLAAVILLAERPGSRVLAGIALAVASIVLVGQQRTAAVPGSGSSSGAARLPSGLGLALLSGVAIGLFFFALARSAPTAGLWPLLAARLAAVAASGVAALAGRRSLRMATPVTALVIAAGVLDVLATDRSA
jgi:uncharacterized membrane protein